MVAPSRAEASAVRREMDLNRREQGCEDIFVTTDE
jgi:hypothetical protein